MPRAACGYCKQHAIYDARQELHCSHSAGSNIDNASRSRQVSLLQPFDVVRTRMQAEAFTGKFQSTRATFRIILAETGVRGLWRGTSATVTRLALGAGTHFFFLDIVRPKFESIRPDGTRTLTATGAAMTGAEIPLWCRLCRSCQRCNTGGAMSSSEHAIRLLQ